MLSRKNGSTFSLQLLFKRYPLLKTVNDVAMILNYKFKNAKLKEIAFTRLAQWYYKLELSKIESYGTVELPIQVNYLGHYLTKCVS